MDHYVKFKDRKQVKRGRISLHTLETDSMCDYCGTRLNKGDTVIRTHKGRIFGPQCHKGRFVPEHQRPTYQDRAA